MSLTRREIRTLTREDLATYIESIKIIRNTTQELGVKRYGDRFKSYDLLTAKHAVSALHKCGDQGHTSVNQLTFHRALTLEFEQSLMAVVRAEFPSSTLQGVPYWNWFLDVSNGGDWSNSTLWQIWGSPYGDPEKNFEIHDPVFDTIVPNITNRFIYQHLPAQLRQQGWLPVNKFGVYRSPWSSTESKRLVRNPGWVFGTGLDVTSFWKHGTRDCFAMHDFKQFGVCMQGKGIGAPGGTDIGPHNLPHISMGTIHDQDFDVELFRPLFVLIILLLAFLYCAWDIVCVPVLCDHSYQPRSKVVKLMGVSFIGVGIATISSVWVLQAAVGMAGASQYGDIRATLVGRATHGFSGVEWRNGFVECDSQPSCWQNHHYCDKSESSSDLRNRYQSNSRESYDSLPEPRLNNRDDCKLASKGLEGFSSILAPLLHQSQGFAGSDYWDGVYSINENFFFSVHAFYDLLFTQWIERVYCDGVEECDLHKIDCVTDIVSVIGFPTTRIGRCIGSKADDIISEDMCFTKYDLGFNSTSSSCMTHEQVLQVHKLYTYDRLSEKYSWVALEPEHVDCPPTQQLCDRERRGEPLVTFRGSVVCVQNERLKSKDSRNLNVVADALCAVHSGTVKPTAPTKVCHCSYASIRDRSIQHRLLVTKARKSRAMWYSIGGICTSVVGIVALTLSPKYKPHIRYERVGEDAELEMSNE